jgi:NAD(P)-dependent dehydrogenase (short-subunit alcohol dehydrogenase family)
MKLSGKVAVVTGAASGIGRATALLFAAEGAAVVAADLDEAGASAVVAAIRERGGRAEAIRVNVADGADARAMIERAATAFGGLDILVNNAGIAVFKGVEETTEEEWDRVLGVNLRGVWLGIKHAAPAMRARGGGSIVNIASVHGMATQSGIAAYAASKHAVIGLTRAAALDLAKDSIRVNCIQPGAIDTPLMRANMSAVGDEAEEVRKIAAAEPIGRVGRPDEIAQMALWLASDDSSFATGAPFAVDGGLLAKLAI